jgi:hypothetical protein
MEYSIEQVDNAIYYYLSTTPDKFISINKIYSELINENICHDLMNSQQFLLNQTIYLLNCYKLCDIYNNITKEYKDSVLYLRFNTKSIVKENNLPFNTIKNNDIFDNSFNLPTELSNNVLYFKTSFNNSFNSPTELLNNVLNLNIHNHIKINDYINKNDTIIHHVCREGDLKLLLYIKQYFDIDINLKNINNETLLEVLPGNSDGLKIQKILLENHYEKLLLDTNVELEKIKTINFANCNMINELELKLKSNIYKNTLIYVFVPILIYMFFKLF